MKNILLLVFSIWEGVKSQQNCSFSNISILASQIDQTCKVLNFQNVQVTCEDQDSINLPSLSQYILQEVQFMYCNQIQIMAPLGKGNLTNVSTSIQISKTINKFIYFQAQYLKIDGIFNSTSDSVSCIMIADFMNLQTTIQCASVVLHQSKSNLQLAKTKIIGGYVDCPHNKTDSTISFIKKTPQYLDFKVTPELDIKNVMSTLNVETTLDMYIMLVQPQSQTQNYSVMIVSQIGQVLLNENTTVQGNRIGVFGSKGVQIDRGVVIEAGGGCMQNQGPGRGVSFYYSEHVCTGSGGSSAGHGGIGIGITNNDENNKECMKLVESAMYLWKLQPYNGYTQMSVGSGGGQQQDQEQLQLPTDRQVGAGGGLIVMETEGIIALNGKVAADGMSGYQQVNSQETFGGGGGGGSVIVRAELIKGEGMLSARGGDSDKLNRSGEGGGGVIYIEYYNPKVGQSSFTGTLTVAKGRRIQNDQVYYGTDGSIIYPSCMPGMQLRDLICMPCDIGYRSFLNDGVCKPCPIESSQATLQIQCPVSICSEFYCDPLEFVTQYVSSLRGVVVYVPLFMVIVGGYIIRRLYRLQQNTVDDALPFDFDSATKHMVLSHVITDELRMSSEFRLVDLLYHSYRIVMAGNNTWSDPWMMPQIPTETVEYLMDSKSWSKYAIQFNRLTEWSTFECWLLSLFACAYYPLYWVLLRHLKKKKWQRIVNLNNQKGELRFQGSLNQDEQQFVRYKFTKSSDYTLLYLDIFNYKNSDMKYFFLQCPFTLLLSGQGDYLRPYYLCECDPFISCLYFAINRSTTQVNQVKYSVCEDARSHMMDNLVAHKKRMENSFRLNKFLTKFNRQTRTIDYGSGGSRFGTQMRELLILTKQWNLRFFCQFSVQIELIVMQTSTDGQGNQQITVLENEDSPKLLVFLSDVHQKYVNKLIDVKLGLFVYDIELNASDVDEILNQRQISFHEQFKSAYLNEESKSIDVDDLREQFLERIQRMNPDETNKKSILSMKSNQIYQKTKGYQQYRIIKIVFYIFDLIRYIFISHRTTNKNKYTIILLQLILSFVDGIFLPIYIISSFQSMSQGEEQYAPLQLLFWPFPFAIFLSPIIGCLWMSTQSYGIAKLHLIFTGMSFIDLLIQLILKFLGEWTTANSTGIAIEFGDLMVKFGLIVIGKRILSVNIKLNKLNYAKIFTN